MKTKTIWFSVLLAALLLTGLATLSWAPAPMT